MSLLALGAMTFGQKDWGTDEDTARALFRHYLDSGGNDPNAAGNGRKKLWQREHRRWARQAGDDGRCAVLRPHTEQDWRVLDTLTAVAEEVDRSPAQVAINWVTWRPEVVSTLVGARSVAQLTANLTALDFELTAEQQARLEEAGLLLGAVPALHPVRPGRSARDLHPRIRGEEVMTAAFVASTVLAGTSWTLVL